MVLQKKELVSRIHGRAGKIVSTLEGGPYFVKLDREQYSQAASVPPAHAGASHLLGLWHHQ